MSGVPGFCYWVCGPASEMLGAGLSVPAVAAILGDTPTTVLKTYAHFVAADEDRVRLVQRSLRSSEDSLRTPRAADTP